MNLRTTSFAFAAALLASSSAYAIDRNVPAPYSTVQSAIDAAQSGDTVRIGPGVYEEAVSLTKSGISIVGGKNVVVRTMTLSGANGTFIKKVAFGGVQTAVTVQTSHGVTFKGCEFGLGEFGLAVDGSSDLVVLKCLFAAFTDTALRLNNSPDAEIIKSVFADNDLHSIALLASDAGLVHANVFAGAGIVWTHASDGVAVMENVLKNSSILYTSSTGALVMGNVIKNGVFGYSIYFVNTDDSAIAGNKIKGGQDHGIIIHQSTNNMIIGNKLKKPGALGIRVTEGGNTFQDNVVKKSGSFDIYDEAGAGANTYIGNKYKSTNL